MSLGLSPCETFSALEHASFADAGTRSISINFKMVPSPNAFRKAKASQEQFMKQNRKAFAVARFISRAAFTATMMCVSARTLLAISCPVARHATPSDADKAFLAADFSKAASLYQAALEKQPGDADLTAGLVHALLGEGSVPEAADAVSDALAASPKSAALITLRGEVELRQGEPWLVEPTVIESYKLDPCNARTRLLYSHVLQARFRYATARQQILLAHQFDPADPDIRLAWIKTLPPAQQIAELDAYLSAPTGLDQASTDQLRADLSRMKKNADEPVRACRLVSPVSSGDVPFIRLAGYAGHTRAYGLEAGLNGNTTRLQIDTRGAGLTLYRSAADRVGLKRLEQADKGEVSNRAAPPSHTAYADSVKLGGLEFRDCAVNVIDSASPFDDGDGMIGIDVFSEFMVTLDFPMRKLGLGPLPALPGETSSPAPSLKTIAEASNDLESVPEPPSPTEAKAGVSAPTSAPAATGPHDRFIAAEMKDYTLIYHAGHDLILPAALNGDKVKLFVVDAGAGTTSISPGAAMDVAKVHEDKSMESAGPGGRVARVLVADEINFNFAHVSQKLNGVVSSDTSAASRSAGMAISGFLGMNTLSLLTLHIDYRDGLLKADYVPGRGYKFE
jgi:tetratricopeptide (TPR) repeat protein